MERSGRAYRRGRACACATELKCHCAWSNGRVGIVTEKADSILEAIGRLSRDRRASDRGRRERSNRESGRRSYSTNSIGICTSSVRKQTASTILKPLTLNSCEHSEAIGVRRVKAVRSCKRSKGRTGSSGRYAWRTDGTSQIFRGEREPHNE